MVKQLKDMVGTIAVITEVKSQEFTAKHGKTAGQKFTICSRGLKLEEHEEWANIKGKTEDQVDEKIIDHITDTRFNIGDYVKVYLEAEDEEGKYWRVVSICRGDPDKRKEKQEALPAIPIEDIEDSDEEIHQDRSAIGEVAKTEEKLESATTITPKIRSPVEEFKEKERNKFDLGMSKKGACILLSQLLISKEDGKTNWKELEPRYKPLAKRLYKLNCELSKEHLT